MVEDGWIAEYGVDLREGEIECADVDKAVRLKHPKIKNVSVSIDYHRTPLGEKRFPYFVKPDNRIQFTISVTGVAATVTNFDLALFLMQAAAVKQIYRGETSIMHLCIPDYEAKEKEGLIVPSGCSDYALSY